MTSVTPDVVDEAARGLLERHLSRAREWFPHELVPWSEGRDMCPDEVCEPSTKLTDGVASALWIGLLTEDNLPHYFHAIGKTFPADSALGEWSRRWAAEEGRHAIVIRDWVSVTRSLDLCALERARMRQVSTGFQADGRDDSLSDAFVYLALQELATRISHWNTGKHLEGAGSAILQRVAADENLHFLFYRDMTSFLLEADPSAAVIAIDRQVTNFEMPGAAGIENFAWHASMIAGTGIYDYRVHYEQILLPVVLRHWALESLTGLTAEAEAAREHVLKRIARFKRVVDRMPPPPVPDLAATESPGRR